MEYLPAIISALGTIAAAWFAYNQYTKNKLTDVKIERWKREEETRSEKRSDNAAKIFGELWQLLHNLKADRVYIIQPHPLSNNLFLSIKLEVKRNGVSDMKSHLQKLPMSEVAVFSAELSQYEFKFYRNIEGEVKDKKAKSLLNSNGSTSAVIRRLSNDRHDWIGSLVCDFTRGVELEPAYVREETYNAAERIQYILPELKNE